MLEADHRPNRPAPFVKQGPAALIAGKPHGNVVGFRRKKLLQQQHPIKVAAFVLQLIPGHPVIGGRILSRIATHGVGTPCFELLKEEVVDLTQLEAVGDRHSRPDFAAAAHAAALQNEGAVFPLLLVCPAIGQEIARTVVAHIAVVPAVTRRAGA